MDPRVVVITGGSAGIGAAAVQLLAARGDAVVPVARRAEKLEEVAREAGGTVFPVSADMEVRAEVRRAVDATLERFGRVDVWVNNAGRGISRLPSELTDDDIDAMMRANVLSALYGMQEVLPHFKERGQGHLINVSSLLGRVPFATIRSAYCGAKHFLNALTATFRAELAESHPGIRISLLSPGVVRTDFGNSALHGGPDSRSFPESQSAEEVAAVLADVIDTGRPDVYTRAGFHERIAGYYASHGTDP
ncbi:MAG: SDR family oxidoreductase [Gemmatimonadota bacterium]